MSREVAAEVVMPKPSFDSFSGKVSLGWPGKVAAGLTIVAAGLVVLAFLFGKVLLLSLAVTALWPLVFSAEFTRWVFGSETVAFWKVFLMFTVTGVVIRWFRNARTWL